MLKSVRTRLTALYIATVSTFLAIFVAMDYAGLKKNLAASAGNNPDTQAIAAMEETLLRALEEHILLAVILIIPVSFLGYYIIKRALSPVRDMARLAKQITAQDLNLRIKGVKDTGEIGELAETFNGMIDRLQRSFSKISQFSADVSHELKTPLTVLRGEIDVCLKKDRGTDEYIETMKILKKNINDLCRVIDNLFTLSVLDSEETPEFEEFSFDTVILETFEKLQEQADGKSLEFKIETLDEVEINGNRDLISLMLFNIIHNSVKYTEEGSIIINLKKGDLWELSVTDTGCGIPEEYLEKVFDRFFMVDKSRSSKSGGKGLGLSLVKNIAETHNLKLDVESSVGRGTTIRIGQS